MTLLWKYYENATAVLRLCRLQVTTAYYGYYRLCGKAPWFADGLESWDISPRSFRISWMNNWRSEMVGIKGNKKLQVQFNILCMIYRWWNRGVSWGSNKLKINSVQTSDPNLNPDSVKLEFDLGSSWGSSWRSSWRSLKHPIDRYLTTKSPVKGTVKP